MMKDHHDHYYGGVSWANELARRGYAVLVHDAFPFASRRVRVGDVSPVLRKGLKEVNPESVDGDQGVQRVRRRARAHHGQEPVLRRDDLAGRLHGRGPARAGLPLLAPDVDADRVGCAGLSGGGMRTCYLGGLDDRIRCACCVGMMTTWRDYLLNKCHTHTWMIYIPGLPRDLDYPEILGLRARCRRWS